MLPATGAHSGQRWPLQEERGLRTQGRSVGFDWEVEGGSGAARGSSVRRPQVGG